MSTSCHKPSEGRCCSTTPKKPTVGLDSMKRGEEPVPSLLNHYRGHKGSILSLAFHPNLQSLYSSSADGYIMCWNYKKETRALRFEGHTGPVNEINLTKNGDLMISASEDRTFRVWVPVISGQYISIKGHNGPVRTACFNPTESSVFATGSNDKTVKIWSVAAAKMKSGVTKFKEHDFLQSYTSHKNWVRSVRFAQDDGQLLCSCSDDKTIQIFDLRYKDPVVKLQCDLGSPLKADFNPCGHTYVGVATTENAFLMYDIRQRKLIQSYVDLFSGPATSFSFHPSGDFAVCVSEEAKIKILDLIEGRPIFTLYGPRRGLCATAFNWDGKLFATGGKDQEVLIWEPTLIPYADNNGEEELVKSSKNNNNNNGSTTSVKAAAVTTSTIPREAQKVHQEPQIVGANSQSVRLDSLIRPNSGASTSSASTTASSSKGTSSSTSAATSQRNTHSSASSTPASS